LVKRRQIIGEVIIEHGTEYDDKGRKPLLRELRRGSYHSRRLRKITEGAYINLFLIEE
jgi:hypothetical protein